ncbi:MAG: hypothetical protein AAGA25_12715 [Planctomycetota bacterium]
MAWNFFKHLRTPKNHQPVGGELETMIYTDPDTGQKIEIPIKGRIVLEGPNGAPIVINTHEEVFLPDGLSVHTQKEKCLCYCGYTVSSKSVEEGSYINHSLCRGCRREVVIDGKTKIVTLEHYQALRRRQIALTLGKKLLNTVVDVDGKGDRDG